MCKLQRRRTFGLLFWVLAFSMSAKAYNSYMSLFDGLRNEAPEVLDMEVLKSYPKFRNIHHDCFDRLPEKVVDNAGVELQYYTLADGRNIGKNSYQNKENYAYTPMVAGGASFAVGVKQVDGAYVACNEVNGRLNEVKLLTIDAKVKNYGMMVKRGPSAGTEAKVAFRVVDAQNYYYSRLTDGKIWVYRVTNGLCRKVKAYSSRGAQMMYLLLEGNSLYVYADWMYIGNCKVKESESTTCGLMFCGNERSEVDDFVVERFDEWGDNGMDTFIEMGEITPKQFGSWQTEDGLITANKIHTYKSEYSLRFELEYYDNWELHKVASKRRTEICPKALKSAPLDSWISSFDIYLPGKQDGEEYYAKDGLSEIFWQSHDRDAAYGLSPHVAMCLENDVISFQTLSRALLRYDKNGVSSNKAYNQNGRIAALVDELSGNAKGLELKRGEWHNFTIYIREGYTEAQMPRTIVYVDGRKVIDWRHPNAYNCGQNAEYQKMGIYKWPWAKDNLKTDVRKRVLYYDNIVYLR